MQDSLAFLIDEAPCSEALSGLNAPRCLHRDENFGLLTLDWAGANRYELRYDGWELQIDSHSAEYVMSQRGRVSELYIRERIAVPFIRLLRGAVLLHAGAVERKGEVIAFLAPSGVGKSTMTAAMLAFGASRLVADDVLTMAGRNGQGHVTVLPDSSHLAMRHTMFDGFPFVKSIEKVDYKHLLCVHDDCCHTGAGKLKALVILDAVPHCTIQSVPFAQVVPRILAQQLAMSCAPEMFRVQQFHRIIDWLGGVPCFLMGVQCQSLDEIQNDVRALCRTLDS